MGAQSNSKDFEIGITVKLEGIRSEDRDYCSKW